MNETLQALKERMEICKACRLHTHRTQIVFGQGNEQNPLLMLIGEGPGAEEDEQGLAFVGAAGQKLDRILKFLEIDREQVYIVNAVLCKPPKNRTPNHDEIKACRWRLLLQIEEIQPRLIVLLGRTAINCIHGDFKGPMKQFFGDPLEITLNERTYKAFVTYHPSYLLRTGRRGTMEALPHWQRIKNELGLLQTSGENQ